MKHTMWFLVLLSLTLTGCGKTAEQKAMEESLNAEVLKLHERQMDEMKELKDLISGIDIELSNHDRLAAAHPREFAGKTPDDLVTAKNALVAARAAMQTWMSSYKMYDPGMKHEDAMTKLTKDRADLVQIQASIDSARGVANAALDAHRALVAQLTAPRTTSKK